MARMTCVACCLVLFVPAVASAAEDNDLVGTWEGTAEDLKEVWTIKHEKNQWSVSGAYFKDGKQVGSFQSKDPKFDKDALTFVQKFEQKPKSGWKDGNVITARLKGTELAFTWKAGKAGGAGQIKRGDDAAKAGAAAKNGDKKDLGKVAGDWEFKSFVFNGMKIEFGATWSIKDGKILEKIGGLRRRDGTVTIDESQTPKTIDINFTNGNGGGAVGLFHGIYEFDGNAIKMCLCDKARPTEFVSKEGSGVLLLTLTRVKMK